VHCRRGNDAVRGRGRVDPRWVARGVALQRALIFPVADSCAAKGQEQFFGYRYVGVFRLGVSYRCGVLVYVARRAAGTLKVWFPLVTEPSEQLRFLREAEERAIKTVAAELLAEGNQRTTSQMNSPRLKEPGTQPPETNPPEEPGQQEGSIRKRTRQVEKWREDANVEARKGTNWSHDWTSKTHSYQLGLAIHELARLDRGGD